MTGTENTLQTHSPSYVTGGARWPRGGPDLAPPVAICENTFVSVLAQWGTGFGGLGSTATMSSTSPTTDSTPDFAPLPAHEPNEAKNGLFGASEADFRGIWHLYAKGAKNRGRVRSGA